MKIDSSSPVFKEIVDDVQVFLEANYPCQCDNEDPDCPGEYYEALEITEMIMRKL